MYILLFLTLFIKEKSSTGSKNYEETLIKNNQHIIMISEDHVTPKTGVNDAVINCFIIMYVLLLYSILSNIISQMI